VDRLVPCKACGAEFKIPEAPGVALLIEPTADDGLYELASDPDDEPTPPPAAPVVPKLEDAPQSTRTNESAVTDPPVSTEASSTTPAEASHAGVHPDAVSDADESAEQEVYVSDAVKARRREEQRIAAAANEPARSWRDFKGLITIGGIIALFAVIYLAMLIFSSGMD
jgi:hypothetical protein